MLVGPFSLSWIIHKEETDSYLKRGSVVHVHIV